MSQKNYFAYNIIDTLYFNKPTGQDLIDKYGLDYIRKTDSEYEKLISKYKFDYYLVNDSQQIFIYLKNNEHYKPVYKGKDGYYIYKYEK